MTNDSIQSSVFKGHGEKSLIDKFIARQDVDTLRELIKKPKLNRVDLQEMSDLMAGGEMKLLNFGEWDRYVINKFFVWIREYIKITLSLFSVVERVEDLYEQGQVKFRIVKMFRYCQEMMENNVKFLIDVYLLICRTTLSINATGFMELLKNKYEVVYPGEKPATPMNPVGNLMGGRK